MAASFDIERASALNSLSRVSPTQHVQRQLIAAIRSGELAADKPFPTEKQLCEMFNVSRVSVREALAGLVATGLIEIQQGKRTSVRASTDQEYAGLFGLYIELHKEELADLLEIRSALDGLAAAKAVRNASRDSLRRVETAHDAFKRAAVEEKPDPETLKELDVAFHTTIADAAQSPLLSNLLAGLNDHLVFSREVLFSRAGQLPRSVEGHQRILDRILAGDAPGARDEATEHVLGMWSWVEHFKSYDPGLED